MSASLMEIFVSVIGKSVLLYVYVPDVLTALLLAFPVLASFELISFLPLFITSLAVRITFLLAFTVIPCNVLAVTKLSLIFAILVLYI